MSRRSITMSPAEWRAFLQEERTAVVASTGRDGFPHLAAMWYLVDDQGLLMWTYAKSQKAANLRRNPRVGVLVEAGERYEALRGVLVRAEVEIIEDFERVYSVGLALHARYAANYSESTATAAEQGIRAQAAKRLVIRVPYAQVTSWDHRKLT
jgi:PPOX class probable F420-dependent enzyme